MNHFHARRSRKGKKALASVGRIMLKHNSNHTSHQVSFSSPQSKQAMHPTAVQDRQQCTWAGAHQYHNFQGSESPMYMSTMN